MTIHHIWFDFSETIAGLKEDAHDKLRYETYALVTGKPLDNALKNEFEQLYERFNNSNAAIFDSLGQPPGFWSNQVGSTDPASLYKLKEDAIPDILKQLREKIPISIFSNIQLEHILPTLRIEPSWFTHILGGASIGKPKPALDGFYKIIELSAIPKNQILYIGDHVEKDVLPAKRVGIQAGIMWKTSLEADYSFQSFAEILAVCA